MKSTKLTELGMIEYIRKRFPVKNREIRKGIGDDAMVFRNGFLVTTDSFFEGVHFDLGYFSMVDLGRHIMSASLSDIAAMCGQPLCALVSLNLTPRNSFREITDLYQGFEMTSKKYGFDISGGDIVQSPCMGVTITVIGKAVNPVFRSAAKPGQALYVTNFLGLAEVGRAVLSQGLPKKEYPTAIEKHLCPEPRIKEAGFLKKYVHACIDTSDGLSTDAMHLADESRVKIVIDIEHVPIHSEVGRYCTLKGIEPFDFILGAGEDFELLFTAKYLPKSTPVKIFRIGRISKGRGLFASFRGKIRRIRPSGYEHLKNI